MDTPSPPLLLALFEPDIAQNTGAIMRTCACLGVGAAIIEPAGFRIGDSRFRRAGMDYLEALTIEIHDFVGRLRGLASLQPAQARALDHQGGDPIMGFRFS